MNNRAVVQKETKVQETIAKATKLQLYETGPQTLMGRLLRRFWHPIALSADVARGNAVPVTVMWLRVSSLIEQN